MSEGNGERAERKLTGTYERDGLFRILSLDGGGAKGVYTLGILKEMEGMLGCPLYQCFDLVYGTSTGSIIAALLALGFEVDQIVGLYRKYVPIVMGKWLPRSKSDALATLATEIFGERKFTDFLTKIGVVATKWDFESPIIFKSSAEQAHGRIGTFVPGFGVTIAEAVQASCSAFPFFKRRKISIAGGETVDVADGGYWANNPSLCALADALSAQNKAPESIRMVSLGVGIYPPPKKNIFWRCLNWWPTVRFLQKTLEINTQSMELLCDVMFKNVKIARINQRYAEPEMATDFVERDPKKLDKLWRRGRESFGKHEAILAEYLKPVPLGGLTLPTYAAAGSA
jgi:predicted patatin/cPLA2 family phospholipase